MTMMGWRLMYWLFFAVGIIGIALAGALLLRAVRTKRPKTLIAVAAALTIAGLGGTLIVAVAAPGEFGDNMMGMGGMGMMMGDRTDVAPAPSASPGAPKQVVAASEFAFSPSELNVKAGVVMNVELHNSGSIFHTFTVTDLEFELEANGGQTAIGALRADRAGVYEFICLVPGHAQSGMRGRVIVS
jgi:uncharacterized cupredoxin-like copper-binding protein